MRPFAPSLALRESGSSASAVCFVIVLVSLTVHEAAHAWTADRLGDPTARLLGRVSLNPLVHIDLDRHGPVAAASRRYSSLPIIGWAKPVPVNISRLRHPRRDFMIVAAAGPLSNLLLAVDRCRPRSGRGADSASARTASA